MNETIIRFITIILFLFGYFIGFSFLALKVNWLERIFFTFGTIVVWSVLMLVFTIANIAALRPFEEGVTKGHLLAIIILVILNACLAIARYKIFSYKKI